MHTIHRSTVIIQSYSKQSVDFIQTLLITGHFGSQQSIKGAIGFRKDPGCFIPASIRLALSFWFCSTSSSARCKRTSVRPQAPNNNAIIVPSSSFCFIIAVIVFVATKVIQLPEIQRPHRKTSELFVNQNKNHTFAAAITR